MATNTMLLSSTKCFRSLRFNIVNLDFIFPWFNSPILPFFLSFLHSSIFLFSFLTLSLAFLFCFFFSYFLFDFRLFDEHSSFCNFLTKFFCFNAVCTFAIKTLDNRPFQKMKLKTQNSKVRNFEFSFRFLVGAQEDEGSVVRGYL